MIPHRIVATVKAAALIILACLSVRPQTPNKVVEWSKFPFGSGSDKVAANLQLMRQIDGIEIEEVKAGDQVITIGEPFSASVDWMRDLTFRVKNLSKGSILGIQITVVLPEMKSIT